VARLVMGIELEFYKLFWSGFFYVFPNIFAGERNVFPPNDLFVFELERGVVGLFGAYFYSEPLSEIFDEVSLRA
jgi:hypothetical protein